MPFYLYVFAFVFYLSFIYFWIEFVRIMTNLKISAITKPFLYTGIGSIFTCFFMAVFAFMAGYGPVEVLSFGMIAPIPY